MNFASAGFITGILAMVSAIANATGHGAFGAFVSDPSTVTELSSVVTGILALVAGLLPGLHSK